MAIYGGFAGGEASISERDINANISKLSGNIAANELSDDNSYHVIYNKGGGIDNTAILDGFTISSGNANNVGENADGGGMYIENASPSIRNCTFSFNQADERGGGLYCEETNMTLDGCSFNNNSANTGGGAANYLSLIHISEPTRPY